MTLEGEKEFALTELQELSETLEIKNQDLEIKNQDLEIKTNQLDELTKKQATKALLKA